MKNISNYLDPSDTVLYEGVIRSGGPGEYTKDIFKVRQSSLLDMSYLDPFPTNQDFYLSEEYRESYNSSSDINDFYKSYDNLQAPKLNNIDLSLVRNSTIADFGCGGGSFLDLVSGLAKQTFAVEPYAGYHAGLAKNHIPFTIAEDLYKSEGKCLDHAFSFQVIEHVDDPIEFLRSIAKCCKKGATITIATPNKNDLLFKLGAAKFNEFYYRTVHLWYFSLSSLTQIGEDAGLKLIDQKFIHNYDAANLIRWLRDSKATGTGGMEDIFDESFDSFIKNWAEANEISDDLQVTYQVL